MEKLTFREEVRDFLLRKLSPELRREANRQAGVFSDGPLVRRWHRLLFDAGWIAPAWPKEHGGTGWSAVERYIFDSECAQAGAPVLPAMGLQMCGPVIMAFGTPEQKAFFLPRILSGEHYWCQGYSEPQSGSDLASLQMRARRDGDNYIVDGTKLWTTHAQFANWIFLLVRTDPSVKSQEGISFLVCPMDSAGITVRPIWSISGDHEVNQVFFDSVRIPCSNRIGDENRGWQVAKYLLEFERGAGSQSARLRQLLKRAKSIVEHEGLWDNDQMSRARIAELEIAIDGMRFAESRVAEALVQGRNIGNTIASQMKLQGSEILQAITELAVQAVGHYAMPDQTPMRQVGTNLTPIGPDYAVTPTAKYLNARAATIYGGSSEVQRNILAKIALGL